MTYFPFKYFNLFPCLRLTDWHDEESPRWSNFSPHLYPHPTFSSVSAPWNWNYFSSCVLSTHYAASHFRSSIHHVYSVWHAHLSFINMINISSPDFKHVLPERGCLSSQIFTVFVREHVSMSFHLTQLCATWGHRPCMLRFNTAYIMPSPLYSKYFWNKISVEDYVLFLFIK